MSETPKRLLTQAEVDALPDGTGIVVRWSGHNQDHVYTARRFTSRTWATMEDGYCVGALDYVGPRPLTEVSLVNG